MVMESTEADFTGWIDFLNPLAYSKGNFLPFQHRRALTYTHIHIYTLAHTQTQAQTYTNNSSDSDTRSTNI